MSFESVCIMIVGQYSLYEWLIFFYIYSFLGWIFESSYVSFKNKRWINRGFLEGPFLPIYGGGAVMMLFVSEPFKYNMLLSYIAGAVGATLLELATGIVMESIFKVKYWDYSYKKYNYKGYICLSSTIAWGFFTVMMNQCIHPIILRFIAMVPTLLLHILSGIVSVYLVFDICISVKEALDMRDMLEKIENLREDMLRLRRRADVVIACLDDSWREFTEKNPAADKVGEIYKGLELRYNKLKQNITEKDILNDVQKEELAELKERFNTVFRQMEYFRKTKLHKRRKIRLRIKILGNPTMSSTRYRFSLETLKERLRDMQEEKPREN